VSDQVIYPSELFALGAFLFAPPLLLALIGQGWFLLRRGIRRSQLLASFAVTAVFTTIIGSMLFVFGAAFLPSRLGFKELWLGREWIPVMPLFFVVVAVIAPIVSWYYSRRQG
jgi:hypothetical protein